jgi:hypothetical protein
MTPSERLRIINETSDPVAQGRPIDGIRTLFHPGGCFQEPDGKRFDYIFSELARDPSLPPGIFPAIDVLLDSAPLSMPKVVFHSRHGQRRRENPNRAPVPDLSQWLNRALGVPWHWATRVSWVGR